MSILQRRNQLGKQKKTGGPDCSIAATLEQFELSSHPDENNYYPTAHNQDLYESQSSPKIADSIYSENVTDEHFARWTYPSPTSLQKWSPIETETETELSQLTATDGVASPSSASTIPSSQPQSARWRRGLWGSGLAMEARKSPTETMLSPNFRSVGYRRQVYSDTPAPACAMSSPGLSGRPAASADVSPRKPFRHSASPVSNGGRTVLFNRGQTPSMLQSIVGSDASVVSVESIVDLRRRDESGALEQTVTEKIQEAAAAAPDTPPATDAQTASESDEEDHLEEFIDRIVSANLFEKASPSSKENSTSQTLFESAGQSEPHLQRSVRNRKVPSRVTKRRRKKELTAHRIDKSVDDGFFKFNMSAQVSHGAPTLSPILSGISQRVSFTARGAFKAAGWIFVLSSLLLFGRFLLWVSNPDQAGQGTSPGMMVPDLIKVAGLARSFEPLIHFSENGVRQIGELEDSGVAVWDLGESVRQTNMSSGPVIVSELEELGNSLNLVALEMTRFYTSVDADMDNILIVMDWARRELAQATVETAPSRMERTYDRVVEFLADSGFVESEHDLSVDAITFPIDPDSDVVPRKRRPKSFISTLARMSNAYRTRSMIQITFLELVGALEEAIANELRSSTTLFGLLERVDHQFNNLQRLVAREQAGQERAEIDALESLWTRLIGGNIAAMRKFQTNRRLLGSLRECTKSNKALLSAHNHRLLALRTGLEALRKRLVRPLVRGQQPEQDESVPGVDGGVLSGSSGSVMLSMSPSASSSAGLAGIPDQIRGIEAAYDHLQRVREGQRDRVMRLVYGIDENAVLISGIGAGGRPVGAIRRRHRS